MNEASGLQLFGFFCFFPFIVDGSPKGLDLSCDCFS